MNGKSFMVIQQRECYARESNGNLKSAIKIRTTARLSASFKNDTNGLKSGRQVAVRYCIEK